MKKRILCLTAILLLFTNCNEDCKENCKEEAPCKIDRPKDIKPIDWENYNDVYSVFWNYRTLCSEIKEEDRGREIMVYGWVQPDWDGISVSASMFALKDDRNDIIQAHVEIKTSTDKLEYDLIQKKLDSCDLTKKCFIKGKLDFHCLQIQGCSKSEPQMYLENVTDIYFEK